MKILQRVRSVVASKTFPLFLWLVFSSVPILWYAREAVIHVQLALVTPTHFQVGDLGDLPLSSSPSNMLYDKSQGRLSYAGLVDNDAKKVLVDVVRDAAPELKTFRDRYLSGVDHLAFESSQRQGPFTMILLFLGGISGVLGVQLRSIVNFVGHACFRNDLDPVRWWPYYLLRPLTGFILGIVLIAIVQSGFISVASNAVRQALWWAALAFLAGFGEEEFTQRLRIVSKSIFGEKAS